MMKRFLMYFATIMLTLMVLPGCNQQAKDVKAEIEEANIAFMEAVNNGDKEALYDIYLPDAVIYPPNADKIYGADNIVPIMAGTAASGAKVKFETVSAMAYGSVAIEEGQYKILAGDMVVDHGKYIVTWQKKGDNWLVSQDIYNTSMPASPKAAPGDEVLIAITTLKPEFAKLIDEFTEIFLPAFKELYPDTYSATRFLKTAKADKDGNFYFIYISDPLTKDQVHNTRIILNKKYGEEETKKIMEKYIDIFNDQKGYIAVEQVW